MKGKLNSLKFCFLLIAMIAICGCDRQTSLRPAEYLKYLLSSESPLNSSKVLSGIRYKSRMQTPELLTLYNNTNYSNYQSFEADKKNYEDQLNFVFLIEDETHSDHIVKEVIFQKDTYSRLLAYGNGALQNDFQLELPNKQLISCSIAHIESANSVQPVIRIAVAFNLPKNTTRDFTLIFDDKIFNSGKIKFHYGKEVFNSLPQLKI